MADRIKNYQQEADQITTLKAIRTDLGVTPSSYTPDATVVTKDRVVTFAQAEEELVVLSDIEKGVKQQIVDVDIAQKDITNIKALLQGHLYDYQTDSTSAYTKSVPAGAMPYAGIEQIGGKTIVWNQLVNTGTTTVSTISGHKYYTLIDGTASIVTSDGSAITIVDDTADMVCDLTLMFGSGNEPSTTADFTAIYPATHYSYNAGTLLSAGVTEVESVSVNLFDKDTFFSGKAGWDGNKYSGNISLITASFPITYKPNTRYTVSLCAKIGTATYPRPRVAYTDGTYDQFASVFTDDGARKDFTTATNKTVLRIYFDYSGNGTVEIWDIKVEVGTTATNYSPYFKNIYPIPAEIQALEGYGWSCPDHYNYIDYENKKFMQEVGSRAYVSGDESDSTVITDGTTTYYPLNPAIETDISAYITDDNLIQVESGGTLTFPNSNGTDYQIPVPSEETYMIDLQEAINNG